MDLRSAWRESIRLGEEYSWLLDGKPYYNIHPNLVSHLCRCNLSKIPASYLEVPGGFDTALIRLSGPCPEIVVDGEEYVRSILISHSIADVDDSELDALFTNGTPISNVAAKSNEINLRIDLGERGTCDGMAYIKDWLVHLPCQPDRNLDEEFSAFETAAPQQIAPGTRRREVLRNCVRMIATVGLIANSPQDNLLQFDVLAKDRQRFEAADEEVRQSLISRARRRGKHGWNVGTNEMFVPDLPKRTESSLNDERGQHSHAHIRTGHLHAVRCGPGRKDVKIKWFRPTVVRPDLPFAST
ncbi:hypothetical protein LOC67_20275 [Stieleria sp. JC731]|uniref:hypothetical protein n=1 Tax=Pirellulaceae TaxID=2691357 RepID=UPI001E40DD4F|nr:hypothetical protein [Stieleria sp. JC731]MCC9602893.1 hypothetical protein [Stieleria sp. JC731]